MGHDSRQKPEAWPSPGPFRARGGSGRFSVCARDKKPRLSGASVAGGGTPDPSVVRDESDHYDARRHCSSSIEQPSCMIRAPCRSVILAAGQRATAAR